MERESDPETHLADSEEIVQEMETERHKEPESKGRQDHRHMQRDSETEREKDSNMK